jgi:hypothetical protein
MVFSSRNFFAATVVIALGILTATAAPGPPPPKDGPPPSETWIDALHIGKMNTDVGTDTLFGEVDILVVRVAQLLLIRNLVIQRTLQISMVPLL